MDTDAELSARLALSVVVIVTGDTFDPHCDTTDLDRCLEALERQSRRAELEIIVPYHNGIIGISELQRRYGQITFLSLDNLTTRSARGRSREHHDEMRAKGVAAARAPVIGCLEDHVHPAPDWAERMLDAHRQPVAAVGGAIENAVDRPLNWAVYFCDLGKYQPGFSAGESTFASLVNIAYKHSALDEIRSIWENVFNETRVNAALLSRGDKLVLRPEIVVYHERTGQRLGRAVREFAIWGKSYGRIRAKLVGLGRTVLLMLLAPVIPLLLVARMAARVAQRGRFGWVFIRALPITAVLACAWSIGEVTGYAVAMRWPPVPATTVEAT